MLQLLEGSGEPQEIRQLTKGEFFGEKALLSEDVRTASIISHAGGVTCLVIEREFFEFCWGLETITRKRLW